MLLDAERKFRRINSPELLPAVATGQQYHDGLPIKEANTRRPPPNLFTHLLTEPRPREIEPQAQAIPVTQLSPYRAWPRGIGHWRTSCR